MDSRTLTRPDQIRDRLESLIPAEGTPCTVRFVGQASRLSRAFLFERGRILLALPKDAERPKPGSLVNVVLEGGESFHAEVWPQNLASGVLIELPRILDMPQRRSARRVKSRSMRLGLFAHERIVRTVLVDLSEVGVGFLTGDAGVGLAEPGTRFSARIDDHGVAAKIVLEIVRTEDGPGTNLYRVGARICSVSASGRRFLRHRCGAAARRGAA